MTFVSKHCEGELCHICGHDAQHKIEETIFDDDPNPIRHPCTAYVCHNHFRLIMGRKGPTVARCTED